jgi:succinate dehydrogenase/fumarate reductase flavoprotein subunit
MMLQFERFGIDISKDPKVDYPTPHYQNGGVKIDTNSETNETSLRRGRGLRRITTQSLMGNSPST